MSLVISNSQYINGLDVWEASINPLPALDFENLNYVEKALSSSLRALSMEKSKNQELYDNITAILQRPRESDRDQSQF